MNEILKFLIGTTGISVVLIFLGKHILYFLRDLGLEKYKKKLSIEIIKFQSELDKRIEKFKISYSNLFVEQVVVMKETYKKLIKAEKPLEYLMRPFKISPVRPDEEVAKEVVDKANELFDYFDENELIFNEKTTEIFNLLKKNYIEVWKTFTTKQFMGNNISGEMWVKLTDNMMKAYDEKLQCEMQKLKKELKKEFQLQLGIIEAELLSVPNKNDNNSDKTE